jgi:polyisoprenoid-binding protein YceI
MRRRILLTAAALVATVACGKPKSEETPAAPPATADAPKSEAALEDAAAKPSPEEAPFDVSATPAGVYKNDASHAYITYSYDHQGYSRPWLRWRKWDASLNWNPAAPEQSTIAVTIDANSADSGVDEFDTHLKSPDFFDVAQFPTITFTSTAMDITGGSSGRLTGDLTIKGVTKPATLDVKINKAAFEERWGVYKLGFSAHGAIKRSDFGVDRYVPFVGDDVTVVIEAEFVMPKEAPPAP